MFGRLMSNYIIMTEEFIQYLWQFRLLKPELQTDDGEPLTILHPGNQNPDGGPDFFNSRIRIGETVWAGNVEVHIIASDWYRHKHHKDKAYDNVILHVVFTNDLQVFDRNQKRIPTISVKGQFEESVYERYRAFLTNRLRIPCEQLIKTVTDIHFEQWAAALAVERLEQKTVQIRNSWEACRLDWEETFYQNLLKAFGFKINALPFELLAKSLPFKILMKHRDNLLQAEALLFGQAGMLEKPFSDEYPGRLRDEYHFLHAKYSLKPIDGSLWKFLRLRPSNFPSVRIAQLAELFARTDKLLSRILEINTPEDIPEIFSVTASGYWDNHYILGKASPTRPKLLGEYSIRLLTLNLVIPFLFFFGKEKGLKEFMEKGMTMLESLPGETNADLSYWEKLGMPVSNALNTQALIQLKTKYCDNKKCLSCRIGARILNS
jgi:hypothetical protein